MSVHVIEVSGQKLQPGVYLRPSGKYGIGQDEARRFDSSEEATTALGNLRWSHPQLHFRLVEVAS